MSKAVGGGERGRPREPRTTVGGGAGGTALVGAHGRLLFFLVVQRERLPGAGVPGAGDVQESAENRRNAPGRILTSDPRFRKPVLYPAELRALQFLLPFLETPLECPRNDSLEGARQNLTRSIAAGCSPFTCVSANRRLGRSMAALSRSSRNSLLIYARKHHHDEPSESEQMDTVDGSILLEVLQE